jgi:hypothetical protein
LPDARETFGEALERYENLPDDEKELTEPPTRANFVSMLKPIRDEQVRTEYREATEDDRAAWKQVAADVRAQKETKKKSTKVTKVDMTAVLEDTLRIVSISCIS